MESEDDAGIYFVSAELDGTGLEGDGDIMTWATESPGGAQAIYALDDLALEHSDYRDARTAAKVRWTPTGWPSPGSAPTTKGIDPKFGRAG